MEVEIFVGSVPIAWIECKYGELFDLCFESNLSIDDATLGELSHQYKSLDLIEDVSAINNYNSFDELCYLNKMLKSNSFGIIIDEIANEFYQNVYPKKIESMSDLEEFSRSIYNYYKLNQGVVPV